MRAYLRQNQLIGLFFGLVLLLLAPTSQAQEPIRLGGIFILSGEGAAWGIASRRGVELALEEINAAGGLLGRPVEVLFEDDQGDPKKALSAFQKLVDLEGINLLLGPNWSRQGEPLIPLVDQKNVLMISPSLGVASFNEASPLLFNTWPHDYLLSEALAEHVYRKGHRNVALVGAQEVWVEEQTRAFKRRFEELGGSVAYLAEPLPGTTDLKAIALRIKAAPDIDAYVSTTDGVLVGSLVAKELKQLKVALPMFSITLDQDAIDAAAGGFEGLEFLTFLTPTPEFQAKFEHRYGEPIQIGGDSAYDAVQLLAAAIRKTGSLDPRVLAKSMNDIERHNGVSGSLVSDKKGGFTKPYVIQRVTSGKPNPVGP
ncbi:MAG: ABC transporter substrate-binding protein [Bdellovibrionales bacterium]|nr:ABC transporter substrate-binding protein [Bdellovibrionales bacterium]